MYKITNYDSFKKAWVTIAPYSQDDNVKISISSVRNVGPLCDIGILFRETPVSGTVTRTYTIPLMSLDQNELGELAQLLLERLKTGNTDFPDDLVSV